MEQVNVTGTHHVLEALRFCKVPKVLHLSSVVAVGAGFTQNEILNEASPYSISHLNLGYFETKKKAEDLVVQETKKGFFESFIVNPSTIYGPADAKKGSRSVQLKVAKGKFPFYTGGGVNVVAVEDVIDGIMLAIQKGRSGERYILCGENWTIQKLFTEISQAAGVKAPQMKLPNWALHGLGLLGDTLENFGMKGGISRENAWTSTLFHWFDNSKARNELGFKPRPSRQAIEASVGWIRSQGLLNK
jgi:dihydroflavonol-4-reductase